MRLPIFICQLLFTGVSFLFVAGEISMAADYSAAQNAVLEAAYIQSGYKEKVKQLEAAGRKRIGNKKVVTIVLSASSLAIKRKVKIKAGPWKLDAGPNSTSLTFTVGF